MPPAPRTSKDQRARSLEDFNAVGIVEIPEDLTVIAHAVEEEVGGRGHLAANGDLVAVAFTLMDDDAGHVPGNVADALEALILDLLLCHDAHRLRDIAQWRIRLGRGAGPRRSVADVASGVWGRNGNGRRGLDSGRSGRHRGAARLLGRRRRRLLLRCSASTLSGGKGVVWVCASAIVAGLAAARHAAVTSVVTEASFLTGPALAGLRIGWRREPGMRTELIVPPMHVGACVPRWCRWLAGGLPGYKATHARILD